MSDKKERILLTQIKQDFTTPVDAIADYINLILESSVNYDEEIIDEFQNIKKSAKVLRLNFFDAFKDYAEQKNKTISTDEEASVLRHDLRTPLNGIIGYSEILLEDFEDDVSADHVEDLNKIVQLAKEVESVISNFVEFLRHGFSAAKQDEDISTGAESVFSSLGKIDSEIIINESISNSKILIVDDNKTNCDVLERRLKSKKFDCTVAMSGKEALKLISQVDYDLILLDVLMPEINGLEVLMETRKKYDLDKLPVIMVSSFDDVESISKCLLLGANDYLPKPLNSTILLAKVAATLERKILREREKELLSELHYQAITDELTQIPNRRYVFDSLEKSFSQILNENKEHFAVVILDIDHFKNVNDTYGHAAGDEIIKAVSKISTDIVSSPNLFGRIGGEEFLGIIHNSSETYLREICEKIRTSVEELETLFDNQNIKVTISGGCAFTNECSNTSDLINKADERLYSAKKNGRNRFYFSEE